MKAYLDTNVIIRHLTGRPKDQARRATRMLAGDSRLVLTEMVLAECVFVLRSVYDVPDTVIAEQLTQLLALPQIEAPAAGPMLRALHLLAQGHGFVDSYLVASAEAEACAVASFDKGIDAIGTVPRLTGAAE